tara:strand:+ start:1069 stop:1920 length:852 start_codon:yes stop_codon:yes gene_type:complete
MSISKILKEATNGTVDETVLSEIESAFEKRLTEKTQLHVDKALLEQDELYTSKLEQLLEAIDTDHSSKLNKVVEAIEVDRAAKLKAVVSKYESVLTEDAKVFKEELVESISSYLDAYLQETIPAADIQEAVKNKKAIKVLEGIRNHLAVDGALQKESIKDAVIDGHNQINEATTKLESALQEKSVIEEELNTIKANLLIEQKTANLDERSAKYVKKMFTGKPSEFITENFDYTLKLFNKKEDSRLEGLKVEALKDTVKVDRVIKEKVEATTLPSPYLTELSKY